MTDQTETVAEFDSDGQKYELDHLGIGHDNQYGAYAVYQGDRQIAEFETDRFGFLPGHRTPLPPVAELILMAKVAVAQEVAP